MRTSLLLAATLLAGCLVGDLDALPGSPDEPVETDNGGGQTPSEPGTPIETNPGPLPAGKHAFVLAHGLGGSAQSFDDAIAAAIGADGHAVLRTSVPGVESVQVRATALGPQIDKFMTDTGATKIHIIAHSMGGLDARYLASKLGYAAKVASITTISSPHRGSPLADLALGITQSDDTSQDDALDAIIRFVGQVDPAALDRALIDLSVANAPAFNAAVPDVAGVVYESYAGLSTPGGIDNPNAAGACAAGAAAVPEPDTTRIALVLAQPIVANGGDRLPNDGVVGVASSKWGTFRGCIAADHLDETGVAGGDLDKVAFYKAIAARLAP